jgi:hypothetical protein
MEGKTDQENEPVYVAAMRNKDVRVCVLGALAIYMFQRFHIDGETFPDFREDPPVWYKICLVKEQKRNESISYDTRYRSVKKALSSVGINKTSRKTHSGRAAGEQHAWC